MDKIFALIEEDRKLCRILMGENGDPQFLRSLLALCREPVLTEWQKEFPKSSRKGLEFAFDYVFAGATRLILNWIDDDHGLTADQFGKQLERLGHYSLVAVGDFPEAE